MMLKATLPKVLCRCFAREEKFVCVLHILQLVDNTSKIIVPVHRKYMREHSRFLQAYLFSFHCKVELLAFEI